MNFNDEDLLLLSEGDFSIDQWDTTFLNLKDEYIDLKTQCEIIYYHNLAKVVGSQLNIFLNEKIWD